MKKLFPLILVLLVILGNSCRSVPKLSQQAGDKSLEDVEWVLVDLNGVAPIPDTQINIAFTEGQAGGFAGCNAYGGMYDISGRGKLTFKEIAITAQACLDPGGVMDQEGKYIDTLMRVEQFQIPIDRLELLDSTGKVLLVFQAQEQYSGDPRQLAGSTWQLANLDGKPLDGVLRFTIGFEKTRYHGLAGCRHYEGRYQAGDGKIQFPIIEMLENSCPDAKDDYYALEGAYTDSLTWARYWRIVDGQLEIQTARGEMLVFVPTEEP